MKLTSDEKSFLIDGERRFPSCGEIHYARAPRAEWAGIHDRSMECGINTVATYVFWNKHEPEVEKYFKHLAAEVRPRLQRLDASSVGFPGNHAFDRNTMKPMKPNPPIGRVVNHDASPLSLVQNKQGGSPMRSKRAIPAMALAAKMIDLDEGARTFSKSSLSTARILLVQANNLNEDFKGLLNNNLLDSQQPCQQSILTK